MLDRSPRGFCFSACIVIHYPICPAAVAEKQKTRGPAAHLRSPAAPLRKLLGCP
jgi:hypothetical protein